MWVNPDKTWKFEAEEVWILFDTHQLFYHRENLQATDFYNNYYDIAVGDTNKYNSRIRLATEFNWSKGCRY